MHNKAYTFLTIKPKKNGTPNNGTVIGQSDSKYEIMHGFGHLNSYFSVFHYINSPPGGQREKNKANHLHWK